MKFANSFSVFFLYVLVVAFVCAGSLVRSEDTGASNPAPAVNAPAPKPLVDLSLPAAASQVKPNFGEPVYTVDKTGISVQLPAGKGNYAGIQVYPPAGAATWDLTPYGRIEAKITNTGTTTIRFNIVAKGVAQGAPAQDAEIFGNPDRQHL